MGRYSYSQPSSSSQSLDLTSLIEAEAEMYAAEAEIIQSNAEAIHYLPSPEGDDGIPRACYCGSEPVHGYSQTAKDRFRHVDPPPFTPMHHRIRLSCCEWSHPCPCWCCVAEPRHGRVDQRGAAASFRKPAVFFICDPTERTVQFGAEIHRYGSKP
ncbi:hypothetical protein Bca52824_001294 [Brassica carinata]|uniref:Uncharacterized protein n=1 Tax=Brassica carinata TaxID=52824 RepID=A0A8X8B9M9_BRACI|nr:hypothetical protein Bca52824_001294 [Brassica carinata]